MIYTYITIPQALDLPETQSHPTPPNYNAVWMAAKRGAIKCKVLNDDKKVEIDSYLNWLNDFPHTAGRKARE